MTALNVGLTDLVEMLGKTLVDFSLLRQDDDDDPQLQSVSKLSSAKL